MSLVTQKTHTGRTTLAVVLAAVTCLAFSARGMAAVPDEAKKELNRGIEFTQAKKPDSAIMAYQAALKIAPDFLDAHINIGALYYEKGDMVQATGHLKKAIALDSTNTAVLKPLGLVYFKTKDYDGAISALKQCVAVTPNDAPAWSTLGQAYKKKGDDKSALDAFNHAVTADPKDYKSFYHIGNIHLQAKRFDDAVTAYRKAIAISPGYVEAYYNLAITSHQADMEKCIPDYKAFINVAQGKKGWKAQVAKADTTIREITKYLDAKGN